MRQQRLNCDSQVCPVADVWKELASSPALHNRRSACLPRHLSGASTQRTLAGRRTIDLACIGLCKGNNGNGGNPQIGEEGLRSQHDQQHAGATPQVTAVVHLGHCWMAGLAHGGPWKRIEVSTASPRNELSPVPRIRPSSSWTALPCSPARKNERRPSTTNTVGWVQHCTWLHAGTSGCCHRRVQWSVLTCRSVVSFESRNGTCFAF